MLQGEGQKSSRRRLVAAFAVTGALAASGIALAAPGDVIQTLNVTVFPEELPKKGGKNAELQITASACFEDTTPDCRGEAPQVPDIERAVLTFDKKDITINPEAVKQCKVGANAIADRTPAEAKSTCGKPSIVGRGFAVFNSGQSVDFADVTAFNGPVQQGRPTILLHAYVPSLQQGTVPVGVLKPGNKVDIPVNPLPGGSTLSTLDVNVQKGKYVQARCTRGKRHTTTSRWTYRNASETQVDVQKPCQVKK